MRRLPGLGMALALNFVWINLSEIVRYLWIVIPELQSTAGAQAGAMRPTNIVVWGLWDTVLIVFATLFYALWLSHFGRNATQTLLAAVLLWAGVFGLLWIGVVNMGLAAWSLAVAALPLALMEQIVAAFLVLLALNRARRGTRPSS